MPVHPKSSQDLLLAPVAVEVDMKLRSLREKSRDELIYELALELDRPADVAARRHRETAIIDFATRSLNLHGYEASITPDGMRLHLAGGSESLDLGLSEAIVEYIKGLD